MEDNRSYESLVGGGFDGSIFEHIVSVENLFSAWREFNKGKTKKPDVIEFSLNLEDNIFALRDELISRKWICDGYIKFSILKSFLILLTMKFCSTCLNKKLTVLKHCRCWKK